MTSTAFNDPLLDIGRKKKVYYALLARQDSIGFVLSFSYLASCSAQLALLVTSLWLGVVTLTLTDWECLPHFIIIGNCFLSQICNGQKACHFAHHTSIIFGRPIHICIIWSTCRLLSKVTKDSATIIRQKTVFVNICYQTLQCLTLMTYVDWSDVIQFVKQ